MKHVIGIVGHAAIAATMLAWSLWAGYTFWYDLLLSEWAAIGALLALDAVAIWGFVMHVLGIPSPFARLRHALPLLSALPLLHALHALAAHAGDVTAWLVAGALTALLGVIAWLAWRGLEALLVDAQTVALVEIDRRARAAEAQARRLSSEAAAALRVLAVMQQAAAEHRRLAMLELPEPLTLARVAAYPEPVAEGHAAPEAGAPPRYRCPHCGAPLANLGQYGAATKHGYCRQCRPTQHAPEAPHG